MVDKDGDRDEDDEDRDEDGDEDEAAWFTCTESQESSENANELTSYVLFSSPAPHRGDDSNPPSEFLFVC